MSAIEPSLDLFIRSLLKSVSPNATASEATIVGDCHRQLRQRVSHHRNDEHVAAAAPVVHVVVADLLRQKKQDQAVAILFAHADMENDPVANRLRAYASLAAGDLDSAHETLERSIQLDPHQAECWYLLGKIAETKDNPKAALKYYERGSFFDDEQYSSTLTLAEYHEQRHDLGEAIHVIRVNLIRDARSAKLNRTLAGLLEKRATNLARRSRYRMAKRLRLEALECYGIVNAREPSRKSLIAEGRLRQQLHQYEAARETFAKAVKQDPESSISLSYLASANVDFGEIPTALKLFEKAIKQDPDRAETHFRYSRAKKFEDNAATRQYAKLLHRLIDQSKPREQKQISLNFALAKVYDDTGRYQEAWQHYQRGNQVKADRNRAKAEANIRGRSLDLAMSDIVDRAIDFFTPEIFSKLRHLGNPSAMPIFIVGMPRSGTTLTEQIVSSHPDVAGAGELSSISQIRFHASHVGNAQPSRNNPNSDRQRQYPDCLASIDAVDFKGMGQEYLDELAAFAGDAARVTDKMPTNFWHLGLIGILFPNATIIHCQRNPMDVMVSCFCQNLNPPFCDFEQMMTYHRDYRRIMRHWEKVLPQPIYHSRYEELVANPESKSRQLINHCALEWSEQCLTFHQNDRAVHTPSKWQVRQPMYQSSVEKWRKFELPLSKIAEQLNQELAAEATLTE
ncbi:tetratricopeptide repeat-containing sulfotransferase family protein [Rhodopirellula sp. MGV]|uniref:tetratricopeptide repeat-containing sulfotransferase family protein n=1 Tax=Rhodopirellula sp. MGV TaxID=2023130 RepID=UPI001304561A|nr:tetratricopeptide repeat-containing sulfotransferase family protein [Rhodopirellula sp. MGV]